MKKKVENKLITTISLPLFSGLFASLNAATVFAPDDIPTYTKETRGKSQNDKLIFIF